MPERLQPPQRKIRWIGSNYEEVLRKRGAIERPSYPDKHLPPLTRPRPEEKKEDPQRLFLDIAGFLRGKGF